MSIEYLRLKGFKSFGTSCEFTFSEGFTAIVGPNGSGKSNILDALRWVLGEGSPSTLRIVRQSDLVFQGSATVNPSKEAEVVLKLRTKQGLETAVLRRQYGTENGSVLSVGGDRIKLQDLGDFKARFMMEGDSFAFIGQGEVAEAIHQRPMQRRHHLELLFGVDRYRKRRDETYGKLEAALAETRRIHTLLQELENRRAEIAPDVLVAVEAKGILDNLENVRRDFYFFKRLSLEKKEQEHRARLQLVAEHLDAARLWRDFWSRALEKAEVKLRGEGFDEGAFLSREQALTARKESLRRQAFAMATRIRTLLSDRRELLGEQQRLEASLLSLDAEVRRAETDEAALKETLKEKRAAFDALLCRLERNKALIEQERLRRQTLRDEHAQRTLARSQAEARIKALSAAREEAVGLLSRLEKEAAGTAAALAKHTHEEAAHDARHKQLALAYSDAYAACQKHAAALQQLKRERIRQEAELDAAKENTEASLYPEPVRLLLSASRLGKMRSKPEVVAEAFSCPAEVASALEAYLGGRQFWLLVRTFDEAQEGIELLKVRRAGRVTYLPLERCHPRFPDPRFRLPSEGVVGWGLELVVPIAPWEPALQHLLGDLLIVRDYALGSGMVKSGARFPIATLEGEVFAPSGTVSGGRSRQSGGAISHNQRITELSAHVQALEEKIRGTEAQLKAAENTEQRLAGDRDTCGAQLTSSQSALGAAQKNLAVLKADIERLLLENTSTDAQLRVLGDQIAADASRVGTLDQELANLEELAESGETSSVLAGARGEIELVEERLRGCSNVLTRIRREHADVRERSRLAREETAAGRAEEGTLRSQLADGGRETLAVWEEIRSLRVALEQERGRVRKSHERLERLRRKEQKGAGNLLALETESAALSERLAGVFAEREQLQELWEEKYPYDAQEAGKLEAGRDLLNVMRRLERELKALGPYNLGALSEDESLTERVDYLTEQLEDVKGGVDELKRLIDETDAQVETLFSKAMVDIDDRFNALFQRLFAGGEARLTLQEEGNLWERGVEIYARPPGKRLQNISQLSGGEQSLTAIAHLFAALEVARMPLAVLDEVDAALDEYNLIRFADLAKEYSKRLQLLVMTHRRTTMERADLIYGVTMVEPGLSKIVGIDVENYR